MVATKTRVRGFSLVELVIVVVIIGVIAAIAVPRISRGAKGASDASLRGSLAGIRNAIDMFAAEHGGTFPDGTAAQILDKMTKKSDGAGDINADPTKNIFGPYLRSGIPALPVCANKGDPTFRIVTGTPAGGTGTEGWVYSTDTGEFIGNCADAEMDETGIQYNAY